MLKKVKIQTNFFTSMYDIWLLCTVEYFQRCRLSFKLLLVSCIRKPRFNNLFSLGKLSRWIEIMYTVLQSCQSRLCFSLVHDSVYTLFGTWVYKSRSQPYLYVEWATISACTVLLVSFTHLTFGMQKGNPLSSAIKKSVPSFHLHSTSCWVFVNNSLDLKIGVFLVYFLKAVRWDINSIRAFWKGVCKTLCQP